MSHDPAHEPYHYDHHGMSLEPMYSHGGVSSFHMQMQQQQAASYHGAMTSNGNTSTTNPNNQYALKRKAPASPPYTAEPVVAAPTSAPLSGGPQSQRTCDVCKYPDPILTVPECGHTFHSRCVGIWPMLTCPYCQGDVAKIAVVPVDMSSKPTQRSGKWTKQEEKFVNMIVDEFDHGTFPLANGTPVRLVLAKLLNCSPMRLSKKFQKNALGKRTYRVPKTSNNGFRICFDTESHQARQIEFSAAESAFRQEVVMLQRKDNARQDGFLELHDLRLAVIQFWVSNFLKFAMSVGQQVDGLDTTEPKKKKQAMQKLREGMFDQLLSWSNPNAPESSATDAPPATNPNPSNTNTNTNNNTNNPQNANASNNNKSGHNGNGHSSSNGAPPAKKVTRRPDVEHHPPPQSPWDTPFMDSHSMKHNQHNVAYGKPVDLDLSNSSSSSTNMFMSHMYAKAPQASFRQQLDKHDGGRYHHRDAMPPLQPTYGGPTGYDYKRRTPTLTPLSMRAGGPRLPDSIFDDHNGPSALDAVLMNTPTNANSFRPPTPGPPPSSHYDPMEPIQQYPPTASWDQMLDDFTGINTQLVDPSLHAWSNIQLT
ncbi:hypothetical protein SPRG_09765 [Saprolegnia parasitica CBS 223.65]|uniref:RING-type domain-containing protein n=1 Tax=Saprolegnia parasitica (strain CBS 223.65) TaxID=695850 RepID=A0A067CEQ2_SAPPC|nr:hypothetical protein SPRG_09765 [Saprolegnia parasitica CBS 223.65]KDO25036.1 hypothetical protein SPRG_09765 [Saprolegnia parasitica CBS 223.65]|eukprot:XP_012204304.1 hypothetical protein SPRG_09765 [Saprolegnia parasitica CBS 223.65]